MTIRISRYGEKIDEVDEYQLSRLADSGQIQPTDLARKEGAEEWKPLQTLFPDLFREETPIVSIPQQQSQSPSIPHPPPPEDPADPEVDTRPPPIAEVEAPPKPVPWASQETENPVAESTPPPQNAEPAIEPVEFKREGALPPNLPPFTTVSVFEHEQVAVFNIEIRDEGLIEILEKKISEFGDNWPSELTAQYLSERGYLLFVPHLICRGEGSGRWFAQVAIFGETDNKGKSTMKTESREGASSLSFTHTTPNWQAGAIDHKLDIDWKQRGRVVVPKEAIANLEIVQPNITSINPSKKVTKDLLYEYLEKDANSQIIVVGFISSLNITNLDYEQIEADPLLYPIVFGSYEYEEKTFFYQVDLVTGALYFGAPLKFTIGNTLKSIGHFLVYSLGIGLLIGLVWGLYQILRFLYG